MQSGQPNKKPQSTDDKALKWENPVWFIGLLCTTLRTLRVRGNPKKIRSKSQTLGDCKVEKLFDVLFGNPIGYRFSQPAWQLQPRSAGFEMVAG